jgi:chloramphenicol O-acetyltransferase type B
MADKHWSITERLHQTVTNPNVIIRGSHSYYSDCWDRGLNVAWCATCTAMPSAKGGSP